MYSKLMLIIAIGFLSVEGKRRQYADSDIVWVKFCLGMSYDRKEASSPYEAGLQLLEKINKIVNEDLTRQSIEDDKQIAQLRMRMENRDYRSTQDNPSDNPESTITCAGYEIAWPFPRKMYDKVKAMVDKAKQAVKDEEMKNGNMKPSVRDKVPPQEVMIEWQNNKKVTPGPTVRCIIPYATINGNAVDPATVTKYIDSLFQSSRRKFDRLVEMGNGVFKSELIDYPPDHLKNRLLQLIAIKEAKEKRSQSLN